MPAPTTASHSALPPFPFSPSRSPPAPPASHCRSPSSLEPPRRSPSSSTEPRIERGSIPPKTTPKPEAMPEAYAVQESSGRSRAVAAPAYDHRITVFSPEGRLYQVEYAFNAVKLVRVTSVAVRGDDSVYIITQRKATDTTSCSHMFPITQRLGLVATDMPGDGRALAHEARNEAAEFRLMWGYEMPPHVLAQWIAARAQICTQHAYTRPYGIGQFYYLTCVLAYWGVVKPVIIFFFLYVLKDLIGLGANGI